MTADESGLPELNPDDVHPTELNKSALLGWVVNTLCNDVDLSDESKNALQRLLHDIRFHDLTAPLADEIVDELIVAAAQDPDWTPPTDEQVDEFKRRLALEEDPTEGESPE